MRERNKREGKYTGAKEVRLGEGESGNEIRKGNGGREMWERNKR